MHTSMSTRIFAGCAACAMAIPAAHGQLLEDGDLERLEIGSPPDCDRPAGAWQFPKNYIDARLCEVNPGDLRIEGDPTGASRNSLLMKISDERAEIHLANLFTEPVKEGQGLVTVQFDIYCFQGAGGGIFNVAGDHGGGGFDPRSDRGPELIWTSRGQIAFVAPEPKPIADFKPDVWQRCRLVIDLERDTFDFYHTNDIRMEPELVEPGLPFRSERLDILDRINIVHFGAWEPENVAFFDNVSVEVDGGSTCYPDCDESGKLDFFDFLCFQNSFSAGGAYADCDGNGELDFFDFLCFQNEFAAGCP